MVLLFVLLFARQGLAVIDTRRLTRSLEFQGRYDSLTGLLNRRSLSRDLDHKIQAAQGHKALVGVMFLDLDRMKHINDAYGHAAGDEVLRHLAQRLRSSTRSSDAIARFGGDEFVLTMTVADRGQLTQVVQRLLTAVAQPILFGDTEFHVTASIGIAVCPDDSADAVTALHHADLAMYRAKALGKNTYSFYEPHNHAVHVQHVRLEEQLRDALRHGTLELHYQPIVALTDTRMSGVEALLRWTCPGLGPVSPLKIVQVAEESGLMPELGAWVLTTAVRQLAEWRTVRPMGLTVAVNVSASQFALADFVPLVKRVLAESNLPGDALVLELTESTLIQDVEASAAKMRELKALGIRMALDDFGTGYSSLSYLRQLPVDILKIDRSFIATVPAEGDGFVKAILALAHDQEPRSWRRDRTRLATSAAEGSGV
ncbi:putative bifunctional diguanylate cyclase/phosphodiesterase [Deinococcus malanensis]|uniref:putative bifunctional diguanylate cyclase/phosphodiesterase n=1 Tax=Deinococcus malanensis TaxID=1706855 RepID=UPI0036321607